MDADDYQPVGLVRGTLRIALAALAALVVVGLISAASVLLRSDRVAVNQLDVSDSAQVVIQSSSSDLKIVEGSADRLVIRAKVTDGLKPTTYEIHRQNKVVTIVGRCARWLSPGCGVSATIAVPKGYPLEIRTSSANVRVERMTDPGRVVNIKTDNGNVTGRNLQALEFAVSTDEGRVSASFSKQPSALKVRTVSGDITARIPRGKIKYLAKVHSDTGLVASSLMNVSEGRGLVSLLSTSGDITVRR
jgi:hypothetical protein